MGQIYQVREFIVVSQLQDDLTMQCNLFTKRQLVHYSENSTLLRFSGSKVQCELKFHTLKTARGNK